MSDVSRVAPLRERTDRFSASESDLSHVAGLSEIPDGCAFPCTDSDPSLQDITFAISLNRDGRFYVIEGGQLITGPDLNGSFGTTARECASA